MLMNLVSGSFFFYEPYSFMVALTFSLVWTVTVSMNRVAGGATSVDSEDALLS